MRCWTWSFYSFISLLSSALWTCGWTSLVIRLEYWKFCSRNGSVCVKNASVPGTSHVHLMEAKVLQQDPNYRYNEDLYQWVAHEQWTYETQVELPMEVVDKTQATLVFETLDGVARVRVNGKQVAATANSFVPYRIDVAEFLVTGVNEIQVVFEPVMQYARRQADKYPYFVPATENFNTWTEPSRRSFVRKAGSDFGWDWGPAYVTVGIAGSAFIEVKEPTVELLDLDVLQVFPNGNEDLSVVDVTVSVVVGGKNEQQDDVILELFVDGDGLAAITTTIPDNRTKTIVELT
uniref:Beta-mannosidase-like galactose-binding domain-containing protein n=1 Tax=Hyaloperonospora arabidopsidis (strain Emoy2) TaxID=559515 RepID=M4BN09_HYAAE